MKIKYGSKIHTDASKGFVNTGFSEQETTVTLWQVLETYQVDASTLLRLKCPWFEFLFQKDSALMTQVLLHSQAFYMQIYRDFFLIKSHSLKKKYHLLYHFNNSTIVTSNTRMNILGHCSLDHSSIMTDYQSLIRQQTWTLRSAAS